MKPPIFILVENSYIDVYDNAEDAGLSLEAIDIEDNLYKAFDAEGRLLKIEPHEGVGKITPGEEQPTHQEELISLLKDDVNYLKGLYVIQDNIKDDLESLVSAVYAVEKGKIPRIKKPSMFSKITKFFRMILKK